MKPIPCTLIGNTSWGYCFRPISFPSKSKALAYAREMISEGYWFHYRIIKHEKRLVKSKKTEDQ